jgi:uncharacterized protein
MRKLVLLLILVFLPTIAYATPDYVFDEEYQRAISNEFNVHTSPVPMVPVQHLNTAMMVVEALKAPRSPRGTTLSAPLEAPSYPSLVEEVASRHLSQHSLQKTAVRILSIDGGGIRGILPLYYLAKLEEQTGRPAYEMFDLIAGTSTGGMIALALSVAPAREVLRLYVERGSDIFLRNSNLFGPKYSSRNRRKIFRDFFGDRKLSDAKVPTIVTAWELGRDQAYHLYSKWPNDRIFDHEHLDMLMSDAALATSAAPTYFEPETVYPIRVDGERSHEAYTFIDGGVFANNPSWIAFNYALTLFPHLNKTDISLLSLGTGSKDVDYNAANSKRWPILFWLSPLMHILLSGNGKSVDKVLSSVLQDQYDRVSLKLMYSNPRLDRAGKNIANLLKDAVNMVTNHRETHENETTGEVENVIVPNGEILHKWVRMAQDREPALDAVGEAAFMQSMQNISPRKRAFSGSVRKLFAKK